MDKQNHHPQKSPLKETKSNRSSFYAKQDFKSYRQDQILTVIEDEINNNSYNILDVILTDPLIKELNSALQKQAEQHNKNKLLESFPQRYKSLLQTQHSYLKLQESLKEVQKESKEVIQIQLSQKQQLLSQIQYFKGQAQLRQNQKKTIEQASLQEKKRLSEQFNTLILSKEQEIRSKSEELNDAQRKLIKTRCQKQNLVEYLQQLREQADTLKRQNQRIIKTITNQQLQISNLNHQLAEQSNEYASAKQKLIQCMTKTQIDLNNQIYYKTKQCSDLIAANQAYELRLRKTQQQVLSLAMSRQKCQAQRYEQIQQVRNKLLQSIRQKSELDSQLQKIKESELTEKQNLQQRIEQLQQALINKNIEIQEKSLQHQLGIHKIKQMSKKVEESKDQTIEQIRQNANIATEQKLLSQQKCLKLEIEKENLQAQNQKLKQEVAKYEKQMLEINWHARKSQLKGVEIEKMVEQFKHQLSKFQQIINEKEEKIQEYRRQVISLRAKIRATTIERDEAHLQLQNSISTLNIIANQRDKIKNLHSKCSMKEMQILQQVQRWRQKSKPKEQKETQFQIPSEIKELEQIQLDTVKQQLERAQSKYQNILQELQEYKRQFKEELTEKEKSIQQLQESNKHLKEIVGNKVDNNSQISKLFNSKIQELKLFYQKKMEDEDKKYRKIIDVLKVQVTELYKEIDLKKSMQQQMFNEIMKVNKARKITKLAGDQS